MATHYDILHEHEVASTQDVATGQFDATGHTTLVIADRQIHGRGRQGREWVEPDIGSFASLAFACGWDPMHFTLLPLCTAVAVRRAISHLDGPAVGLKWPNDLLSGGGKVGGILVEAADQRVTVGCGVNLWWSDPPGHAASLFDRSVDQSLGGALATGWAEELLAIVDDGPSFWPRSEYEAACVTLGSRVRWADGEGIARDVDEVGALVVETMNGPRSVLSGDVHLLGPS